MPPENEARSSSILLVEDSPPIRNLVRAILSDSGWQLIEAADAENATRLFESNPGGIDLLITDLALPGVTGIDLANRLRALDPDLKVLCMSGHALPAGTHASIEFIQKPFNPAAFLSKVQELLE